MPEEAPIDRALFRETEDGATVFFPWGLAHRGYRIPDDGARKKASRAVTILISSVIAIGTWTAHRLQPLIESEATGPSEILWALAAPAAALCCCILGYALWAARFVERFPESDMRIPPEVRLREAAELVAPRKVALIGVLLCGLSALVIWIEPNAWWIGTLGVLLGLGALAWSHLLRRASTPT